MCRRDAPLERRVAIEHVLEVPPVRLTTVPGFETAVFPYTTDIPFLAGWGQPLLFGPGSIHAAHTPTSSCRSPSSIAAVDHYGHDRLHMALCRLRASDRGELSHERSAGRIVAEP